MHSYDLEVMILDIDPSPSFVATENKLVSRGYQPYVVLSPPCTDSYIVGVATEILVRKLGA
jgi:hypothetical protein